MKEERVVIENTQSLEHYFHIFVCSEDERENVLVMIKGLYPGVDIEVTRTGYRVRVLRKKSATETEAFIKNNKKTNYDNMFEDEVKATKPGKRKN